jgi:hypothetical protein
MKADILACKYHNRAINHKITWPSYNLLCKTNFHRNKVGNLAIRSKVCKYVTYGSKTAVMDVIGFLCVSLGSNTVQLHDSLGSRRGCACSMGSFSSENGDRAWGVYYRRAAFWFAVFLWAKGLNVMNIYKEMFHVYGRKCLSRKAVHRWVEKFSQRRSKVADDETRCGNGSDNSKKNRLFCWFRRIGKAMGQVYQCWWRICREINVFFFAPSNITCFTFYIELWRKTEFYMGHTQRIRTVSLLKPVQHAIWDQTWANCVAFCLWHICTSFGLECNKPSIKIRHRWLV